MSIKPIETKYAGHRFRSRLEARWAVVFDRLGYKWQYEPEGYETSGWGGERIRYLPDFYLPDFGTWVEVKGSQTQLDADWARMEQFLDWGSPLDGVHYSFMSESQGLLVLGDVPRPDHRNPLFPLTQHRKGLFEARAALLERGPVNIYTSTEPPTLDHLQPPSIEPYYVIDPHGRALTYEEAEIVQPCDKARFAFTAGRSFRPEEGPAAVQQYLRRITR